MMRFQPFKENEKKTKFPWRTPVPAVTTVPRIDQPLRVGGSSEINQMTLVMRMEISS